MLFFKDLFSALFIFFLIVEGAISSDENRSILSLIARVPSFEVLEEVDHLQKRFKEIDASNDGFSLEDNEEANLDARKVSKVRFITFDDFQKIKREVLGHLFDENIGDKVRWLKQVEEGEKFPGWSLCDGAFTVLLPPDYDADLRRAPTFPARLRACLLKGIYDFGPHLTVDHLMSWACAQSAHISLSDLMPLRGQALLRVPKECAPSIPSLVREAKGALKARFLKGVFQKNLSPYEAILLQETFAKESGAHITVCDGLRTSHGSLNPYFLFFPYNFERNQSAGLITSVEWHSKHQPPIMHVDFVGSSFFEKESFHSFIYFWWLANRIVEENLPICFRWLTGFWQEEGHLKMPSVYHLKEEILCGERPRYLTLEDREKGREGRFMMLGLLKYALSHETPQLILSVHEGAPFLEVPQAFVKEQRSVSRHLRQAFWDKYDPVHLRQVDGRQITLLKKQYPSIIYEQTQGFLGTLVHTLVGQTCEVIHLELPHRDVGAEEVYEHTPGVRGVFDALKRYVETKTSRMPDE
ncbi:MAG: hypothetical protein H2057_03285 [Alphaproteobacteria bacterium]|nr:hypothetical protein [Alphaproteobacteria bacterium]